MMDKVSQEGKVKVTDMLIQRDFDRRAKLKSLKEEKKASAPDHAKIFDETFDEHAKKIEKSIKLLEERKVEKKALPDNFDKIMKDIQNLNRHLSVSTSYLTNYTVRRCMKAIEDIEVKVKVLESELLPKKKFGFKARKAIVNDRVDKKVEDRKEDVVDASVNQRISAFTSIFYGFSDKKGEKLKLEREYVSKKDLELRNLEDCTIHLNGNPSTTHISNATRCTILSGPVSTSVFVENCQECVFVIACQQLRIHSTTNSRFYIHVTSRAIIEDSSQVEFAPYNFKYEGIMKDFEASGLNITQNNWNQVDDFNWLASDAPSPNWKEMNEEDRIQSWPL